MPVLRYRLRQRRIHCLAGNFCNFGDHILLRIRRGLSIHNDDSVLANDRSVVRTHAALDLEDVIFDLGHFER